MGCTSSKPSVSTQAHLLDSNQFNNKNEDHTGTTLTTTTESPHVLNDASKSTLDSSGTGKEEVTDRSETGNKGSHSKRREATSHDDDQPETDLHDSGSCREALAALGEGMQVTVHPDNANVHSTTLHNSHSSSMEESNSSTDPVRRSKGNAKTRRRPTSNPSSNRHLSKARERMSNERHRQRGSASPARTSKKVVQDLPSSTVDEMPFLSDIRKNKIDGMDTSQSNNSVDLGQSSKSHHSTKSTRSSKSNPDHKQARARKNGAHNKKKKRRTADNLDGCLGNEDNKKMLTRESSQVSSHESVKSIASVKSTDCVTSVASEGRASPRKRKPHIGGSHHAKTKRASFPAAAHTALPKEHHRSPKPKRPSLATSEYTRSPKTKRPGLPLNEPRRKPIAKEPAEEPSPIANGPAEETAKAALPRETPAPVTDEDVLQLVATPRPTMPLSAPSENSLEPADLATSTHSSFGHSSSSLPSYLPNNMKANESSMPSLASFSSLSLSLSEHSAKGFQPPEHQPPALQVLPEQEESEQEEEEVPMAKKRRSTKLGNLVQKINPLKNNSGFEEVMSLDNSDHYEVRRIEEQGASSRSPKISENKALKLASAAAKTMRSLSSHQRFLASKEKEDSPSGEKDKAANDSKVHSETSCDKENNGYESECSLDVMQAAKTEEPVVFKFDSSNPNVAQFDPLKAEADLQSSSEPRTSQRRHSVRGKRNSTRRQLHEEGARLHHSTSQVYNLKAEEAFKEDTSAAGSRTRRPHGGSGASSSKKRIKKTRSKSMPNHKPKTTHLKESSKASDPKDNSNSNSMSVGGRDSSMKDYSGTSATSSGRRSKRRHTATEAHTHAGKNSSKSLPETSPTTGRRSRRSTHHAGNVASPRSNARRLSPRRRQSPKPKKRTAPVVPVSLDVEGESLQ